MRLFNLLFFILFTSSINAQVKVKSSTPIKSKATELIQSTYSDLENNKYVVKYVMRGPEMVKFKIEKYDSNLNLIKDVLLDDLVEDKFIEKVFFTDQNIIVLSNDYKFRKEITFSLSILDIDDFSVISNKIKFFSLSYKSNSMTGLSPGFIQKEFYYLTNLNYGFNKDLGKVYASYIKERGTGLQLSFASYDLKKDMVEDIEIEIPKSKDQFFIKDIAVDQNGDFFFHSRTYETKKKRPNIRFENYCDELYKSSIFKVSLNGEIKSYELPNVQVKDATLLAKENSVVIGGVYSEVGSLLPKGTFLLELDNNLMSTLKRSFLEFSDKNLPLYFSDLNNVSKSKGNVDIYDFLIFLKPIENGKGFYLLAEQYYFDNGLRTEWNSLYDPSIYNDHIIASFFGNGDGENSTTIIHKMQVTDMLRKEYGSIFPVIDGEDLRIYFNEYSKNNNVKNFNGYSGLNRAVDKSEIISVKISKDLKVERKRYEGNSKIGTQIQPKYSSTTKDNKLVFIAKDGKSVKLIEATY